MRGFMSAGRPRFWNYRGVLSWSLLPLSALFGVVVAARRAAYRTGLLPSYRPPAPVIVVGNITVGGAGKTPLTLWIVELLKSLGWMPGIVSRGYGGRSTTWPRSVDHGSNPREVGDEPVLLAKRAGCPVAVGPQRRVACEMLLAAGCDILVCDDGMQHYALERDLEIMIRDGIRGWGNGLLMPAGPLREPARRWREADLAVCNGGVARDREFQMTLEPLDAVSLANAETCRPLSSFAGSPIHAVAGIADPQRFFRSLKEAGLEPYCHAFPDHHYFEAGDLEFAPPAPILMTEKDGVKCAPHSREDSWYLPVEAKLPDDFATALIAMLTERNNPHP